MENVNNIFDYLVVIDCWETDIDTDWDDYPRNHFKQMYNELISNFKNFKFDKILFGNDRNYQCMTNRLSTDKLFFEYAIKNNIWHMECGGLEDRPIASAQTFYKNKFLISGKSWNSCVHGRRMGIFSLFEQGHSVYSHPSLCYVEGITQDGIHPVTEFDFYNDSRVKWEKQIDGTFMVKSLIEPYR